MFVLIRSNGWPIVKKKSSYSRLLSVAISIRTEMAICCKTIPIYGLSHYTDIQIDCCYIVCIMYIMYRVHAWRYIVVLVAARCAYILDRAPALLRSGWHSFLHSLPFYFQPLPLVCCAYYYCYIVRSDRERTVCRYMRGGTVCGTRAWYGPGCGRENDRVGLPDKRAREIRSRCSFYAYGKRSHPPRVYYW